MLHFYRAVYIEGKRHFHVRCIKHARVCSLRLTAGRKSDNIQNEQIPQSKGGIIMTYVEMQKKNHMSLGGHQSWSKG